jgi:hypothetical protein
MKGELQTHHRTDPSESFNRYACALALLSVGLDRDAVREMTTLSPASIQALIDAARGEATMVEGGSTRG